MGGRPRVVRSMDGRGAAAAGCWLACTSSRGLGGPSSLGSRGFQGGFCQGISGCCIDEEIGGKDVMGAVARGHGQRGRYRPAAEMFLSSFVVVVRKRTTKRRHTKSLCGEVGAGAHNGR